MSSNCKARQYSDQMLCSCGLGWDMNDPEPPQCRREEVANAALNAARAILAKPPNPYRDEPMMEMREMPLKHLPAFGINDCIVRVRWPSYPSARFAVVRRAEVDTGQGRDYTFLTKAGALMFELRIRETYDSRTVQIRHENAQEWLDA